MPKQTMLSRFDAGDTSNVDLELPDGYDPEKRERVREYAEQVTTGGWELTFIGDGVIWWQHPDKSIVKMYKIERSDAGWHGYRCNRQVRPSYTDDLQEALDGTGEWMADNPLRNVDETEVADGD